MKQLTPEAALAPPRGAGPVVKAGYRVAVAVSDRAGVAQVMLRDRFAGAHTVRTAIDKARTSASFSHHHRRAGAGNPCRPADGIRALPRVVAAGGGVPVEAGGMTRRHRRVGRAEWRGRRGLRSAPASRRSPT